MWKNNRTIGCGATCETTKSNRGKETMAAAVEMALIQALFFTRPPLPPFLPSFLLSSVSFDPPSGPSWNSVARLGREVKTARLGALLESVGWASSPTLHISYLSFSPFPCCRAASWSLVRG